MDGRMHRAEAIETPNLTRDPSSRRGFGITIPVSIPGISI
jgi:hypothetical protein